MPDHQLEIEGFSIVVLGSFNPSIFQPFWFSANNLIRREEAANSKIQIIHRNAAIFSTEWFSLQVTEFNFSLDTNDPAKSQPLRDLVRGTFKILEHIPVTAYGFNRLRHFRMSSPERWHAFGHHFAPKESWNAIIKEPGLRVLMIKGKRESCEADIQVNIEPSAKVNPGVFINVNEHHTLPDEKEASSEDRNRLFLEDLQSPWDDFLAYAASVSDHLFSEYSTRPKKRRK